MIFFERHSALSRKVQRLFPWHIAARSFSRASKCVELEDRWHLLEGTLAVNDSTEVSEARFTMGRDRGRSWVRASSMKSRMPSRARSVGYGKDGFSDLEDEFDEKNPGDYSSFLDTALLSEANNEPIHKLVSRKNPKLTKSTRSDLGRFTLEKPEGKKTRTRSSSVRKDRSKSLTKTSSWFRRRSTAVGEETEQLADSASPLVLSRDVSSRQRSSMEGRYESLNNSRMDQSYASTHTTTQASSHQKSIPSTAVTSTEDLKIKAIRSALDVQEICRDDHSSGSEYEAPLIMTQLVIQESSVDGALDLNVDTNADSIEDMVEFANKKDSRKSSAGGSALTSADVALMPRQVSFNPTVESTDIQIGMNTLDMTFATSDTSQSDLRLALPQLQEVEKASISVEDLERAEPDLLLVGMTTNGEQDESFELVQTLDRRTRTRSASTKEKEPDNKETKSWFSRFFSRQQSRSGRASSDHAIAEERRAPEARPLAQSCSGGLQKSNNMRRSQPGGDHGRGDETKILKLMLPPPPPPPLPRRRESRGESVIKIFEPTVPVAKKNFQVFEPIASGRKIGHTRTDKRPQQDFEPDDLNQLKIFTRASSKTSKQKNISGECEYPFDHEDIKMIQIPSEIHRTLSGLTAEEVVNFVMETAHLEDETSAFENIECKLEGTKIMEIHSKKPIAYRGGNDDDLSGSIDFDALSEPSIDVASATTLDNLISWNVDDYLKTGPLFAGQ